MGRVGGHSHGTKTRAENEEGDGGGTTAITAATTRIYVGGLGESVTADDLRKTFSSLGGVESVEIVRTKDRIFAYLDFAPSSDKSLSKLFSTYNGCVWKGRRLKLEKAKEHYLLRLRREWAEDAKLENNLPSDVVDASKEAGPPKGSKKVLNPEKPQLQFFFPKLKKLKSLPFSGTGKHKYSFQRVAVPPLPTHFCDCEEHSQPVNTSKEKTVHDLETQSGGVNEEELKIMNSVMNKLFERDAFSKSARSGLATLEDNSVSKSAHVGDELATLEDNSTKIDDLVDNEEADDVEDDDNLIMNLVAGGNDRMSFRESMGHISANKEPIFDEPQTSIDRSNRNMSKSQKGKTLDSNKKRKSPLTDNGDGDASVSAIPKKKKSLQSHLNKSETLLEGEIIKPESSIVKSNNKRLWSQKSAWRDLVGEGTKSSFHVTDFMPSTSATIGEQPTRANSSVSDLTESENQNSAKHENLELKSARRDLVGEGTKNSSPLLGVMPSIVAKGREQSETGDASVPDFAENEDQNLAKHENENLAPTSCKSQELKGELDAVEPTKSNELVNRSARGAAWLKKSSWTQLVAESNNNPFSISQILPGITFEKHEVEAPNVVDASNSNRVTHGCVFKMDRLELGINGSNALEVTNKDGTSNMFSLPKKGQNHAGDVEQCIPEKNIKTSEENEEVASPNLDRKDPKATKQTSAGKLEISETCSFMRNAASMKEWAKTKAALSASAKKKAEEK